MVNLGNLLTCKSLTRDYALKFLSPTLKQFRCHKNHSTKSGSTKWPNRGPHYHHCYKFNLQNVYEYLKKNI